MGENAGPASWWIAIHMASWHYQIKKKKVWHRYPLAVFIRHSVIKKINKYVHLIVRKIQYSTIAFVFCDHFPCVALELFFLAFLHGNCKSQDAVSINILQGCWHCCCVPLNYIAFNFSHSSCWGLFLTVAAPCTCDLCSSHEITRAPVVVYPLNLESKSLRS